MGLRIDRSGCDCGCVVVCCGCSCGSRCDRCSVFVVVIVVVRRSCCVVDRRTIGVSPMIRNMDVGQSVHKSSCDNEPFCHRVTHHVSGDNPPESS